MMTKEEIKELSKQINEANKCFQEITDNNFNGVDDLEYVISLAKVAGRSPQSIGAQVEKFLRIKLNATNKKGKNAGDFILNGRNVEVKFSEKYYGGKQLLRKDSKVDCYLLVSYVNGELNYFAIEPDTLKIEREILRSIYSYKDSYGNNNGSEGDPWGYDLRFEPDKDKESALRWLEDYAVNFEDLYAI